jgi:hypothetical protein
LTPETAAATKTSYDDKKKILIMEEKILYQLFDYLQKISFFNIN